MKANIARWDQCLRIVVGCMLIAWGVAGGPGWAFVGIPVLATGVWRYSPLRAIRSASLKSPSLRNEAR